jgi:hypothetical protein
MSSVLANSGQGEELVTNGGFENGMQGWMTTGYVYSVTSAQSGAYDASTHPPHSGQYSAKVGYVGKPATMYQTVTIPSKSMAKFTAWYRLEQGSSITILLKASDGSTIQQWTKSGPTDWTAVTYNLNPTYAGQTIRIEFDGQAYASTQTVTGICYNPFSVSYYCSYQTEADFFAFVDDVSMFATLAQYSANVNVTGVPQGLSQNIYVDESQTKTISNGQLQQFTFNIGETHKISVDNILYQDNTTRYYCNSSSTTVTTDSQVTFSYQKQYYLGINSQYGNTAGTGWYNDGTKATFSVDSDGVPIPGILGLLGAKYSFDSWTLGEPANSLQSSILMDAPKSVTATWHADYTLTYTIVAVLAATIVCAILGYRKLAKKKKTQALVYGDQSGIVVDVSHAEEQERTRFKESQLTQVTEQEESDKTRYKKDEEHNNHETDAKNE